MKLKNSLIAWSIFFCAIQVSLAQSIYVPSKGEAAFDGYDLVSYFEKGGPVLGKKEFKSYYDGLTIFFASKENKVKFDLDPARYIPAYGGYCATAVSKQNLIIPNFEIFIIQNNRLLLFEVRGFFNGKTFWEKDPELHEILADKHFRELFKEPK